MDIEAWAKANGYPVARYHNGKYLAVTPLVMGTWRLVIGDEHTVDDGY